MTLIVCYLSTATLTVTTLQNGTIVIRIRPP
jgi:hypothetical protein